MKYLKSQNRNMNIPFHSEVKLYSETWDLGTPKGLWKIVLNSEVVLFLSSIAIYWICLWTEMTVLSSQVVPISQVVFRFHKRCWHSQAELMRKITGKILIYPRKNRLQVSLCSSIYGDMTFSHLIDMQSLSWGFKETTLKVEQTWTNFYRYFVCRIHLHPNLGI